MHKLYENTAAQLAARIRSGEVSSTEVVEAHLARIDRINGSTNAVVEVVREEALAAAERADRASGDARAVLRGVPFTVKENIDCAGLATTHGVCALRGAIAYRDAPVVARLKAAGAILIGRTNLSEMGLRLCTDNPLHGRTLNPWNPALTAGGSSGGDAVAVATGMTPLGIGNDLGGSLRIPAGCCGVAALKSTPGRIPHASSLPPHDYGRAGQAMLVHGPLARSTEDLKLVLSVISGRDIRDPRSVTVPLQGPEPESRSAALVTALPGAPLPKPTLAAIRRAGDCLRHAGWEVEEVSPPEIERTGELWGQFIAAELSVTVPMMEPLLSRSLYQHMMRVCAHYHLADVSSHRTYTERARLTRIWSGFFEDFPVVIGPTWSSAIWPIDADLDPSLGVELLRETTRFILPGNVLGFPSVALPMGVHDGLPVGVQVCADLWREDLCLEAAARIEADVGADGPIDPVWWEE